MNKKKKIILIVSILVAITCIGVAVVYIVKGSKGDPKLMASKDSYEIEKTAGVLFKGRSEIKQEQNITPDPTLEIEKLEVKDKEEVKKGKVLIAYVNKAIKEQLEAAERQRSSISTKLNRSKTENSKTDKEVKDKNREIKRLEEELKKEKEKSIPKAVDPKNPKLPALPSLAPDSQVQARLSMARQELQMLETAKKSGEGAVINLGDSLKEVDEQIKALKGKMNKEVKAEIDGIVYLNDSNTRLPNEPYLRIVSKDTLIKAQANEYDVLKIGVGKKMNLKVLSTGEKIKGEILSVDELPVQNNVPGETKFNFVIKPDKKIRVGFSVEIKEDINTLDIPKQCVAKMEGKLVVAKLVDGVAKKVVISGKLDNDYYLVKEGELKEKDKLSKKPLEVLKGEGK